MVAMPMTVTKMTNDDEDDKRSNSANVAAGGGEGGDDNGDDDEERRIELLDEIAVRAPSRRRPCSTERSSFARPLGPCWRIGTPSRPSRAGTSIGRRRPRGGVARQ